MTFLLSGFAPLVHVVRPVTIVICEPNCSVHCLTACNGVSLSYPGISPFHRMYSESFSRVFGWISHPYHFCLIWLPGQHCVTPFRACWHSHYVPLPCTRMLERFFANFRVYSRFSRPFQPCLGFSSAIFAVAWNVQKFFMDFRDAFHCVSTFDSRDHEYRLSFLIFAPHTSAHPPQSPKIFSPRIFSKLAW